MGLFSSISAGFKKRKDESKSVTTTLLPEIISTDGSNKVSMPTNDLNGYTVGNNVDSAAVEVDKINDNLSIHLIKDLRRSSEALYTSTPNIHDDSTIFNPYRVKTIDSHIDGETIINNLNIYLNQIFNKEEDFSYLYSFHKAILAILAQVIETTNENNKNDKEKKSSNDYLKYLENFDISKLSEILTKISQSDNYICLLFLYTLLFALVDPLILKQPNHFVKDIFDVQYSSIALLDMIISNGASEIFVKSFINSEFIENFGSIILLPSVNVGVIQIIKDNILKWKSEFLRNYSNISDFEELTKLITFIDRRLEYDSKKIDYHNELLNSSNLYNPYSPTEIVEESKSSKGVNGFFKKLLKGKSASNENMLLATLTEDDKVTEENKKDIIEKDLHEAEVSLVAFNEVMNNINSDDNIANHNEELERYKRKLTVIGQCIERYCQDIDDEVLLERLFATNQNITDSINRYKTMDSLLIQEMVDESVKMHREHEDKIIQEEILLNDQINESLGIGGSSSSPSHLNDVGETEKEPSSSTKDPKGKGKATASNHIEPSTDLLPSEPSPDAATSEL